MKLDITYAQKPIRVFGQFEPEPPMELKDFEVHIDGKLCPPAIRDLILMGMAHQAGITGMLFTQVMDSYLKEKGV